MSKSTGAFGIAAHGRNCCAAEEMLRRDFPGRLPAVGSRKAKRTGTRTHSPCVQNNSTTPPFDAAPENFPGQRLAEVRSVIKASFS